MTAPTTREWLRTATDRIAIGSRRLTTRSVGRTVRAIARRVGGWPWWVQLPLAYLLLLRGPAILGRLGDRVHERIASGAWSGFLTASTVLWIVAAYRAGRGDDDPATEDDAPEATGEEAAAPVEHPAGPLPVSPVALVAAVRDIGAPHAQLKPLAEHLGTTTAAVRAAAAGIGWPVKDVRMEGRSSSAGLRWDDCPSPTILAPSPGVVGAGQLADDNDDDSPGGAPREGLSVKRIGLAGTLITDQAETVRHHSLRKA